MRGIQPQHWHAIGPNAAAKFEMPVKEFTSHHLEIPVLEGGIRWAIYEYLPRECAIAPNNKFHFTLHLSSSAYLHIHAYHFSNRIHYYILLQQQEKVIYCKKMVARSCQP